MLSATTSNKLYEMKLSIMAQAFGEQMSNSSLSELSFEDRFGLLVDAEWAARKSNRLTRLIRNAEYAIAEACIEDVEYSPDRKLDKAQIARLSTCEYIPKHHNIILLGASGAGKTYLACAFGQSANRNFFSVKYVRLPDLLAELAIARGDGSYRKLMKQYKNVNLLILDEWLLYPLKESEARDLLEIAEARHGHGSIIFCSQFDVPGWHIKIGEPTLADAICDRIVHNSYTIKIEGDSMRRHNGIND